VQREADLAKVTSILQRAQSEHDKWLAWRNELLFRGNTTSDAALASQIRPQLIDAQRNVDRLAQTVIDLQALLQQLGAPATACLDPCLVGRWIVATSGPLSGLVVRFEADGKETVDYSAATPQQVGGGDEIRWSGIGTAMIATADGQAKIQTAMPGTVVYTIVSKAVPAPVNIPLKTLLGVGGLGSSAGNNKYVCTPDSLSYQGSSRADRKPNVNLTFTRQP
jgi:hypothetical protein